MIGDTLKSSEGSVTHTLAAQNTHSVHVQADGGLFNSVTADEVSAILESHNEWYLGTRLRALSMAAHTPQLLSDISDSMGAYSDTQLQDAQCCNEVISSVLFYVERNRRPNRRDRVRETPVVLRTFKHWDKFVLCSGILYRVSRDPVSKVKRHQFVVPVSLRDQVLKGVHECAGHQGQSRTLSITRQRFFWLHMDRDIRDHVRHCQRCVVSKVLEPDGRAPLESIVTTRPLQLVCIDFWSAEDYTNKTVDVLVVTDHFTRLAQAFPCKDQSARQVAQTLWDKFFCIYGFPERLLSDQGPSFESELFIELLRSAGVSYYPLPPNGEWLG